MWARAREVEAIGTDYCYDNDKKYAFGLIMREENNRAARATNEHVRNVERIQCTMSFSAKQQPILRSRQRGEHTTVNRSLRNPVVLARTKRSKEKHRIPMKDMINSYKEIQMKKSKADQIVNGIYMYYSN